MMKKSSLRAKSESASLHQQSHEVAINDPTPKKIPPSSTGVTHYLSEEEYSLLRRISPSLVGRANEFVLEYTLPVNTPKKNYFLCRLCHRPDSDFIFKKDHRIFIQFAKHFRKYHNFSVADFLEGKAQ